MIFSHAFAGAILGKFIVDQTDKDLKETNSKLTYTQTSYIYFLTILGSIFPDFDLSLMFLNNSIQHRFLITHSFIVYSAIFALLILFKKKININYVLSFYLGIISHLVLDFFSGGIVALAPITYQLFGFTIKHYTTNRGSFAQFYVQSNYMLAELSIFFAYIFFVYRKVDSYIAKRMPIFIFLVACVALGVFAIL